MTRLLPLLAALLVLPLTGCETLIEAIDQSLEDQRRTETGSATPNRTTQTTQLAIQFNGMEVLQDCETLVEGAGDFDIEVSTRSSFASSATGRVYKGQPQISQGDRTGGFGRRVFEAPRADGQAVNVTFLASEIDTAPFRGDFPDPRLNRATNTSTHTFRDGRWHNIGPRYITLGGRGCQVRLHYELTQLS